MYYEASSLFGRIVYMTPVFFNFRMRLYTGFVLSGIFFKGKTSFLN